MSVQTISAASETEFQSAITSYAQRGFSMVQSTSSRATLSKKKHFNWVLAIICLFIPILGWIALIAMIFAAARGNEVVEISLVSN